MGKTPQEAQANAALLQLHPLVRDAAIRALRRAQEAGIPVTITSGYRDLDTQEKLRKEWMAGRSQWPANRPGESAHNYALAFDSSVHPRYQSQWNKIRREEGFIIPPNDRIHAEYPQWRKEVAGQKPEEFLAQATETIGPPEPPEDEATSRERPVRPQQILGSPMPDVMATAGYAIARAALGPQTEQPTPETPTEPLESGSEFVRIARAQMKAETEGVAPPAEEIVGPTKPVEAFAKTQPIEEQPVTLEEPQLAGGEAVIPPSDTLAQPEPRPQERVVRAPQVIKDYQEGKVTRETAEQLLAQTDFFTEAEWQGRLNNIDKFGSQYRPAEEGFQEIDYRSAAIEPAPVATPDGPPKHVEDPGADFVDQGVTATQYATAKVEEEIATQVTAPTPEEEEVPPGESFFTRYARQSTRTPVPHLAGDPELKRVSKELGVSPFTLAARLSEPTRFLQPSTLGFGESFERGLYRGLRRYAQIFGADPHDIDLPEGGLIREGSGLAAFLGEAVAATPAFVAGSFGASAALGAVGLGTRLTPLTYHMTRSALAGASLGILKTPVEDFNLLELSKNMTEEAALWTAFDFGALVLTGKVKAMAQAGNEIRRVRNQLRGGEEFVNPVVLRVEEAIYMDAARDYRAVANRIHTLLKRVDDNPIGGAVLELGDRTNAFGYTFIDGIEVGKLRAIEKDIKRVLPEGRHHVIHEYFDDAGVKVGRLFVVDDAASAFTGLSHAQRQFTKVWKAEGITKLTPEATMKLINLGIADAGGAVPLTLERRTLESGAKAVGAYRRRFNSAGELISRKIEIAYDPTGDPLDILATLGHELHHDLGIIWTGTEPNPASFIKDFFGIGSRKTLKHGRQTWLREMRAVQRALYRDRFGVSEGLKFIKNTNRHMNEWELASDMVTLAILDPKRAKRLAPTIFDTWADVLGGRSHVLKATLAGDTLLSEAMIREVAKRVGNTFQEYVGQRGFERFKNVPFTTMLKQQKGFVPERAVTVQRSKLVAEARASADAALDQVAKEGVYRGMKAMLGNTPVRVLRAWPKSNRVEIVPATGPGRPRQINLNRLRFPALKTVVRYNKEITRMIDNLVKAGMPRTLAINVNDRMGGVAKAIIRTQDLDFIRGSREDVIKYVTKELGEDAIKDLDDAAINTLVAKVARDKNFKGLLVDEEGVLTVIADDLENEVAIHYVRMPPEYASVVHDAGQGSYTLSAQDVLETALYEAGIPEREISDMASYVMDRHAFNLRELIDDDFVAGNIDEVWDDILTGVEYFDQAGQRSMRSNGGRVTILPDGSYEIVINEGIVPGGVTAAVKPSAKQAFSFVSQMPPRPGAPDLSRGIPFPEQLASHMSPMGGSEPFAFGETAEARLAETLLDRMTDEDIRAWSVKEDIPDKGTFGLEALGDVAKRISPLLSASRSHFIQVENRGYGPVFSEIWQRSQDAIINVKNAMGAERAVLGSRGKGRNHSFLSVAKQFQRDIQRMIKDPQRRQLVTQYAMAVDQKTLMDSATIMGRPMNSTERSIVSYLDQLKSKLDNPQDITRKIPRLFSNYLTGSKEMANKADFLRRLESSLRGMPTSGDQYNMARRLMKFRENPDAMVLDDYLFAMGHTKEEVEVIRQISDAIAAGDELNLFGISRYFSARMSKTEFAKMHQMTKEEIKLAERMQELTARAIEAADTSGGKVDFDRQAQILLQGILPEVKNWVEKGFQINDDIIKKYFGNHAEFLHQRMIGGEIDVFARDPAYLTWRIIRGKLMQRHWDPVDEQYLKPAMQLLRRNALKKDGSDVVAMQVQDYLQELRGVPHKSFAGLETAVMSVFERLGVHKHVDPSLLRDLLQRMNMVVYKATIPLRPALLVRNASEVYRLGGVVGGKSLGHGIGYVMNPKTAKKALAEARAAGAIKPDLPVFSVDPTARSALGLSRGTGKASGAAREVKRALNITGQRIDDLAEKGMGWYQRVDEYTRAIAYHSMQHRIRTNIGLAKGDWQKFLTKSKIRTFEKPEELHFTKLWQEGRIDEAIEYASVSFADKSLFLYGNANHPLGWGSTYGVLFGQFGTWPVQYKDFVINGLTRGTLKDKLEFAAWNFAAPAALVAEGKKHGLDFTSWWGATSLQYSGGPYADMFIDAIRAYSGTEAERAMAIASLRRNIPATQPFLPSPVVPLSFAANDYIQIIRGERSPLSLAVKTIPTE